MRVNAAFAYAACCRAVAARVTKGYLCVAVLRRWVCASWRIRERWALMCWLAWSVWLACPVRGAFLALWFAVARFLCYNGNCLIGEYLRGSVRRVLLKVLAILMSVCGKCMGANVWWE